jgi:hypothetical protein
VVVVRARVVVRVERVRPVDRRAAVDLLVLFLVVDLGVDPPGLVVDMWFLSMIRLQGDDTEHVFVPRPGEPVTADFQSDV